MSEGAALRGGPFDVSKQALGEAKAVVGGPPMGFGRAHQWPPELTRHMRGASMSATSEKWVIMPIAKGQMAVLSLVK